MANQQRVPYGSDVSGGAFACTDCGYGLQMQSGTLPPCPQHDASHTEEAWNVLYGRGESKS